MVNLGTVYTDRYKKLGKKSRRRHEVGDSLVCPQGSSFLLCSAVLAKLTWWAHPASRYSACLWGLASWRINKRSEKGGSEVQVIITSSCPACGAEGVGDGAGSLRVSSCSSYPVLFWDGFCSLFLWPGLGYLPTVTSSWVLHFFFLAPLLRVASLNSPTITQFACAICFLLRP